MEIKNGILLNGKFIKGMNDFISQPLPILLRIKLKKFLKDIENHLNIIGEAKDELIAKHSEGNNKIVPDSKNWESFVLEYNELAEGTLSIDIEEKIVIPSKIMYKDIMIDVIINDIVFEVLEEIIEVK